MVDLGEISPQSTIEGVGRAEWPLVSVIVPARDSGATLDATLEAIRAQEYPGDLEVVVAIGPSGDGTQRSAERHVAEDPRVRCVANPAGSTPAALNAAIAASTGPLVARVDAHAEIPPGYLRRAVELLRETGADNVGGIQDPVGQTDFEQAVAAAMRSWLGSGGAAYRSPRTPPGPADTVYLGVFRREALERVGGFDETLERNQDYELNIRLRATGGVVWFSPDLRVRYRPRSDLRALARQYHDYGRWKREVIRRHPGSARLRQLLPPAALLANAAALLAGPATRGRSLLLPAGSATVLAAAGWAAGGDLPERARRLVPLAAGTMLMSWALGFLRGRPRRGGSRIG